MKQKWMLVALALLALVALPLVGCKNDSVSEPVSGTEQPTPEQPTPGQPAPVTYTVTANDVASVIEGLSGVAPHTLVATGEWTDGFSTLAEALKKDESKKVNLDLSGVERLETIGESAFYECKSLTSISLPSTVTTIEYDAFNSCSNLATVTFGEGSKLETIGQRAFSECSSLTSISLPSSVTSIGSYAFRYCEDLAEVTFGEGSKLETIGQRAFSECSSLTSISLPSSVTSIGSYAFRYCEDLAEVTFGEGSKLETITNEAFYKCSSLTSITIPASVTTIEARAFQSCEKLAEVTMEATVPPTLGSSAFSNTSTGLQILVPNVVNYTNEAAKEKGWEPYQEKIKLID